MEVWDLVLEIVVECGERDGLLVRLEVFLVFLV